jgi:hypothetical protein
MKIADLDDTQICILYRVGYQMSDRPADVERIANAVFEFYME